MSLRLCLVSAYFIWSCCTSSIILLQWHQTSAALLEPSHTERTDSLPSVLSKEFFLSFHWELCRKHSRTFLYSAETFNYKFLVGFQLVYCITQWQSKNLVSLRPPAYAKSLWALKLTLYVCPSRSAPSLTLRYVHSQSCLCKPLALTPSAALLSVPH